MSNQVPFTAFCPECNGHRTFTIIGTVKGEQPWARLVGCCVCGTSERDALVAVSDRMQDDRATIGEISARINTLDGEVAELRDDHLDLSRKVANIQTRRLLRIVAEDA